MTTALESRALVSLGGIWKRYPGTVALADVSLEVGRGEVLGLVGENGAGKSTLIKIIGGVERADAGVYRIDGAPSPPASPRDARSLGISVLHQERSVVPTFTVGENVLLHEVVSAPGRSRFRRRELHARASEFLELIGVDIDPAAPITRLSAGQLQLIEIARALSGDVRLLVLDEPTASIAIHEASTLLRIVSSLRDRGVSILYVSHKLEEIYEVCDRVSVLRDGANVGTGTIPELGKGALVRMMVGREQVAESLPARGEIADDLVLETRDLTRDGVPTGVSFGLRRGEILGWYGLVGAGRTELARLLIGAEHAASGEIRVRGKAVRVKSVAQALRKHRIGYVSEDRQGEGLFLMHSITRNLSAATWRQVRGRTGLLDIARERERAEEWAKRLAIRTPTVAQLVSNLSGGNKQKVSLGKWLIAHPELLIIDEPTIGLDIRTKYEVHNLIVRLANQGMSIIVISSDLVEVVRLVDRILVFRGGAVVGEHRNTRVYDEMSHLVMADILGSEESEHPVDDACQEAVSIPAARDDR